MKYEFVARKSIHVFYEIMPRINKVCVYYILCIFVRLIGESHYGQCVDQEGEEECQTFQEFCENKDGMLNKEDHVYFVKFSCRKTCGEC